MKMRVICRPFAFLGATALLAAAITRFAVGQTHEYGNGNCVESANCVNCLLSNSSPGSNGCPQGQLRCELFAATTANGTYLMCVYNSSGTDGCNVGPVGPAGTKCTGSVWYCDCIPTGTFCDFSTCTNICNDGSDPNLLDQSYTQANVCTV